MQQVTKSVLQAEKYLMKLLLARDYTEKQLRDKLLQKEYETEMIDEAIDYVKSYGYVDDFRFATGYIRYYSDFRSKGRIEIDLLKKGISKDMITDAYAEITEKETLTSEKELISKYLEKKHFDIENATYEEKQKMMAALYRKGFQIDEIKRSLFT